MMYSYKSRIKYSEIDHTGHLTFLALMDYFQDCSILQSIAVGLDYEHLSTFQKAWVITGWQIEVTRYPGLNEEIKVGTFATGTKGLRSHRNFVLLDNKGEILVKADSTWALIDLKTGRPLRPQPEDVDIYGVSEPLKMSDPWLKIKNAEMVEEFPSFKVKKGHLDTHQHVNNVKYIQMALGFLPEDCKVVKLRVDYKKAALLGDDIFPRLAREHHRTLVELWGEERPYSLLEFIVK